MACPVLVSLTWSALKSIVSLPMPLDRIGDVAKMIAGFRLLEPKDQAFVGDVDELAGAERDVADQIHEAQYHH